MIRKLIDWCIENPLIVVIFVVLTIATGWWALRDTPLDAIPDLSENQVIVETKWPGRGPQVIQDQVSYPLSVNLQGIPKVKDIRAISRFGYSLVYVIFEDGVDKYWARSRVLEKLNYAKSQLPDGVTPSLGPDGTGVGHVYWYVLHPSEENPYDLAKLREIQDYYVRYKLQEVKGVAEVASFGGFIKEYQVDLDPTKLEAYGISVSQVAKAVKKSNRDTGGRILEQSDIEYVVRGKGYFDKIDDIEKVVVKVNAKGVPVTVGQLGAVQLGTKMRRGMVEENGEGEAVGGIVVMRYGANAEEVIDRVKEKIEEIKPGLPKGISIDPAYDRSNLIDKAVGTLQHKLVEEAIVVSLIVLLFLFHARSALIVILTLPTAVLIAFIFMKWLGITSNIMSLGGIAIAIGVIVDASIVLVENAYRMLAEKTDGEEPPDWETRKSIVKKACKQVGPAIFFSMLIIITSFLPVFMLTGREGKLFTPLAWTKTLTMAGSTVLAVTMVPVLLIFLLGGKLRPLEDNVVAKTVVAIYRPTLDFALRFKKTLIVIAALLVASLYPVVNGVKLDWNQDGEPEQITEGIGSEFMPQLDEGSILYMPVTLPNVSVSEAKRLLQVTDKMIAEYPEVTNVLGKVGRADTSTDPAPVAMLETIILLEPKEKWRAGLTKQDIINDLNQKLDIPGLTNGWTQPIINRINMLSTGIRTDLGVKFFGPDLEVLGDLAKKAEEVLRDVPGSADLFAERVMGGHYVNVEPKRDEIARHGMTVEDVNKVVETAIGGMAVTETVEGLARYPVRVRYLRDYRNSIDDLRDILVTSKSGAQVPLSEVAEIEWADGPPQIKSEQGQLKAATLLNVRGRDMGSFVEEASKRLEEELEIPAGYSYEWSGQWEAQKRAQKRLSMLVPAALLIILILIYFAFNNIVDPLIVLLSIPFSIVGGIYLLWWMGFNFSVAVWVGFIALFGVAVETGVVMLVYLHEALDEHITEALAARGTDTGAAGGEEIAEAIDTDDIDEATLEGASLRVRPVLMTAGTSFFGLTPLLWATGLGSGVMKPLAVPMVGGIVSAVVLVLFVIPAIFNLVARWRLRRDRLTPSDIEH